jgi:hypothetical protein
MQIRRSNLSCRHLLSQNFSSLLARIAIFKNAFLGAPLLAKGYENQGRLVAWNVLTHNLWLLAGLPKRESPSLSKAS